MDATLAAWQAQSHLAVATQQPLRIQGSGSKAFYGNSVTGNLLDTRSYTGVVAYQPRELVLTARTGTALATIEALLAGQNQCLPFEPPHFGAGATLGGCVAAGLSGPARAYTGAVRDYVLGVRMLDGQGRDLRFGGTVMKNVAGYDVARLMAGSLGTLGVITEVSLKVLPQAAHWATVQLECKQAAAITRLNQLAGQALPLSASSWHDGQLWLRLAGAVSAVSAAQQRLGGEVLAGDVWQALREQTLGFFAQTPLWRLAVRATAPVCELGECLLEWGGGLRWLVTQAPAATVRAWAQQHGGHATLWRGVAPDDGVFTPLSPALAALQQRIKAAFDPAKICNPPGYPATRRPCKPN